MSELILTVTTNEIRGYLSVDGSEPRGLGQIELARLLSDLACATTAAIVAGYECDLSVDNVTN